MAQVLTNFPARIRTEQYPWGDWFDGIPRLLEEGIDYKVATAQSPLVHVKPVTHGPLASSTTHGSEPRSHAATEPASAGALPL